MLTFRRLAPFLLTIGAIAATISSSAEAHIFTPTSGQYVDWYFYGSTYGKKAWQEDTQLRRSDPLSMAYIGGHPNGPLCQSEQVVAQPSVDRGCVKAHHPEMRENKICGTQQHYYAQQFIFYDNNRGHREKAAPEFELYTHRRKGVDPCSGGYHARFWDDDLHADQTGYAHAYRRQFMLAAFHHEKRVGTAHRIDMAWDDVRVIMYKRAAGTWCGNRRWRVHSGAAGRYDKWENSGMLSRLSITEGHRVASCQGE